MPIPVRCDCGKQFQVADAHAGKKLKCPGCGQVLSIPAPARRRAPAGATPAAVAPALGLVDSTCETHEGQPTTAGKCQVCSGPLCRHCIQENGYFCSATCKAEAKQRYADLPSEAPPPDLRRARAATETIAKAIRYTGIGIGLLIAYYLLTLITAPRGKQQWEIKEGRIAHMPPLLREGKLFAPVNTKELHVIDVDGGTIASRIPLPDYPSPVPPLVVGETLLIACSGSVVGTDLAGSKVKWTFKPKTKDRRQICQPLAMGPGGLIAAFQRVGASGSGLYSSLYLSGPVAIYCLDPATGAVVWELPSTTIGTPPYGKLVPPDHGYMPPVLVSSKAVIGFYSDKDAPMAMRFLDPASGAPKGELPWAEAELYPLHDGSGFVAQHNGELLRVDAAGAVAWKLAGYEYRGREAGLVFAIDTAGAGPGPMLVALEDGSGKERWRTELEDDGAPMAVSDRYVVVPARSTASTSTGGAGGPLAMIKRAGFAMGGGGANAAAVWVLDAATGERLCTIDPGGYMVRLAGDRLFMVEGKSTFNLAGAGTLPFNEDAFLKAYYLPSGKAMWRLDFRGYLSHAMVEDGEDRMTVYLDARAQTMGMDHLPIDGQYVQNNVLGISLR